MRHEAAQRGEEPEDAIQPVMPTPWASRGASGVMVTQAFLGICVAVYVAMGLATGGTSILNPTSQQLIEWGANSAPLTLGGQWWRLLTSMFLHIDALHILFNMWCLWDLGGMCESLYGPGSFAAVYLISGVGGSLASVWWRPMGLSAGASGAIFGIAGALIASYYLGEFNLPRSAISSHLRSLIVFAGYNLLFGAVSGRTDNAAHIGGLGTGLVLGALIARFAPEREPFRRIAVILLVGLSVYGCGAWLYRTRSYQVHASRGNQLLEENKPEQAIAEIQNSIRQRPDYVPAHFALAHAYFKLQRYAEAEAALKRVLELRPGYEPALYQLGVVLLDENKTEEAKNAFTQCARFDPGDGHYGLGRAFAEEGNDQAAVEEYQRALQYDADVSAIYYRMGVSQARLKNYDAAIDAFRKQQQTSGDDYDTEVALVNAYRAKGMPAEADAALQQAQKVKPGKEAGIRDP